LRTFALICVICVKNFFFPSLRNLSPNLLRPEALPTSLYRKE
jgi:hypothetical protein